MDCLENALTVDTFFEFALDGFSEHECSLLEEFMFVKIYLWEYDDVPDVSTPRFRERIKKDYWEMINESDPEFILNSIREYMKGYLGEFAEDLSIKEAKKCTNQKTEQTE